MQDQEEDAASAFGFDGTWREFAPIAFTNLLLTIVTLGFYRFWATASSSNGCAGKHRPAIRTMGSGKTGLLGSSRTLHRAIARRPSATRHERTAVTNPR